MIDLKPIKARCEAASPPPWPERAVELAFWAIRKKGSLSPGGQGARDIDFLTHARTDVPMMVAEIEWLRVELERVIEAGWILSDSAIAIGDEIALALDPQDLAEFDDVVNIAGRRR